MTNDLLAFIPRSRCPSLTCLLLLARRRPRRPVVAPCNRIRGPGPVKSVGSSVVAAREGSVEQHAQLEKDPCTLTGALAAAPEGVPQTKVA